MCVDDDPLVFVESVPEMTLAVFRPTPGSSVNAAIVSDISAVFFYDVARRAANAFRFVAMKPVDLIAFSRSGSGASA